MKKKLFIILIAAAIMACGCSKKDNDTPTETTAYQTKEENYCFPCSGGSITVNMIAKNALAVAGDYKNYVEVASCAFDGLDKIYMYSGFELYVNEISGNEMVTKIVLTDDSVTTAEGLYIGQTFEKLKEVYGVKFTEKNGVYTYQSNTSKLNFGVRDGIIVSIEYTD